MESKKKIVVIDDEPDLCSLMKDILEDSGLFEVFVAEDGPQGMEVCLREKPDLILLDFIMPKLRGDMVVKSLRQNPETKKIPIMLMSGLGEMAYFKKLDKWKWLPQKVSREQKKDLPNSLKWSKLPSDVMEELGVEAYLQKPFVRSSLLEAVKEFVGLDGSADASNDLGSSDVI